MLPGSSTKNSEIFIIRKFPDKFNLVLSRTDSIGDVVLTLPMAGLIKRQYPGCRIIFLGRSYTRDVVMRSRFIDVFADFDETSGMQTREKVNWFRQLNAQTIIHVFPQKEIAVLARKAAIPQRVGTTNRIYHWFNCNRLIALSRKNSPFHEAELNARLLSFLGVGPPSGASELIASYGFVPEADPGFCQGLVRKDKFNLILHPRSKGSAREWGTDNFRRLISILPPAQFEIFISGTAADAASMGPFLNSLKELSHVHDITGKFALGDFIRFIGCSDGLVAASTGPLHIAAAMGKRAVGLYSSRRPIHPGRWRPLGEHATALVFDPECEDCKSGKDCDCIGRIDPQKVKLALLDEAL